LLNKNIIEMDIIYLIIGIIIGGISAFFIAKFYFKSKGNIPETEYQRMENNFSRAEEKNKIYEKQLEELKIKSDSDSEKYIELKSEYSKIATENKNLETKLNEQKKELLEMQETLKTEFKNLANEILEDKSKRFTEQNKELVQNILNPLGEKIGDFRKRIDEIHQADTQGRSSLLEQIKNLSELNKRMSEDADNLTKALKGDSKTMGVWGEFILEKLLERSGLVRDEQYSIQESLKSEEGKTQRPDVIIYLPEEKNVIIDSKVSLAAYERFYSADDEADKKKHMQDHIISIRNHIRGLSGKNYQNLYDLNTPDFVLMFIPIEPAFAMAMQAESTLFNEAFEKNIVIVSPSTLLATLRTIENIWRREKQNKHALEIARQSGALYDKFVGFVEDLAEIGKRLDASKDAHTNAMKKLTNGRGNIIKRIEDIKELGAKASKNIPENLLDESTDE
jgi:DNA recombination protein RmuC